MFKKVMLVTILAMTIGFASTGFAFARMGGGGAHFGGNGFAAGHYASSHHSMNAKGTAHTLSQNQNQFRNQDQFRNAGSATAGQHQTMVTESNNLQPSVTISPNSAPPTDSTP